MRGLEIGRVERGGGGVLSEMNRAKSLLNTEKSIKEMRARDELVQSVKR